MKRLLLLLAVLTLTFLLRTYRLGNNPPSLSWDETSLGYNAFSIANSGTDEHGQVYPISRFEAFGDYKPPGYIYAAVPFIKILGLTEFSVRFPSAIAGFLMVLVTYLLTKELFNFGSNRLPFIAALFVNLSPWALQFSRGAFESSLAAFFNLLGVYLFVKSLKKPSFFVASVVVFILSFYTFNANRIISILILVILSIIHIRTLIKTKRWLLVSCIVGIVLLLPSVSYLQSAESKLRFQEVSIFNNLDPVIKSNEAIAREHNTWWAKILYNRRIFFTRDYLKHYFDNFSGRFLFTHGDVNPRLSIQELGMLNIWELPLLLTGGYFLVIQRHKSLLVFAPWMLVATLPAGTARETPHALRTLSVLPIYQIIAAYGLYEGIQVLRNKLPEKKLVTLFYSFFILLFTFAFFFYLHHYYIHYPIRWSGEWQYGYREMVSYVYSVKNDFDHIFVTEELGRPYIYFLFYGKIPAERFVKNREAQKDAFGFWEIKKWENITFGLKDAQSTPGRVLVVSTQANIQGGFSKVKEIRNLSGDIVFVIAVKT